MRKTIIFLAVMAIAGTAYARITGTNPTGTSADVACFGPSGAEACVDSSGSLIPTTNNDADLGTSSLQWKDGYFDGTLTIDAISNSGASTVGADLTVSSGTIIKDYTVAEFNVLSSTPGTMYICSDCEGGGGAYSIVVSTHGDLDSFRVSGSTVGIQ